MLMLYISVVVTLLDQLTKYMVTCNIAFRDQIPVIPGFLNMTYVRNTGAAWGMFSGFSEMLVALSVVMLASIVIFRRHFIENILIHKIAMGLIVAGIVGNLIDRIRLGYVVDFIDVYWMSCSAHFPAFNVADSSICIGVVLYLMSSMHFNKKPPEIVLAKAESLG